MDQGWEGYIKLKKNESSWVGVKDKGLMFFRGLSSLLLHIKSIILGSR